MKQNETFQKLCIFLGFPRDMEPALKKLKGVVAQLNAGLAANCGIILDLKSWHQVMPGMGSPQQVILNQIPISQWDIFIGVVGSRFGTPSGGFASGTEEEFRLAYQCWKEKGKPNIMFYRCVKPIDPKMTDPDQLKKVHDFFDSFKNNAEHPGLYKEFKKFASFGDSVLQHLTQVLLDYIQERGQVCYWLNCQIM